MYGKVDRADRAIVELSVRSAIDGTPSRLIAWIDTAFTGELVVPHAEVERLGLSQSSAVMAGLADGKQVVLDTFTCFAEWLGEVRQVEVVESECQCALLGIGLLRKRRVEIDYRLRTVKVE